MDIDDKNLLKKLAKESAENNEMLHKLLRSQRWAAFLSFVKFAIIVGPIIAAYVYFQPYFGSLQNQFDSIRSELQSIKSITDKAQGLDVGGLLNKARQQN